MTENSKSISPLFKSVLMLSCMAASTQAAVMVSIDKVQAMPGTVAEVGVYATSDSSDVMTGFNLPLDFNGDGYTMGALPVGFTLDTTPLQNELYPNNTDYDISQPAELSYIGADAIPTASSGGNIQLSSTPTLLFDIAIDVSEDAAVGSVLPMDIFVPANAPTLFNIAGSPPITVTAPTVGSPVNGSVTVVSVPEPTFVSAFLFGALAFTRRIRGGK